MNRRVGVAIILGICGISSILLALWAEYEQRGVDTENNLVRSCSVSPNSNGSTTLKYLELIRDLSYKIDDNVENIPCYIFNSKVIRLEPYYRSDSYLVNRLMWTLTGTTTTILYILHPPHQ